MKNLAIALIFCLNAAIAQPPKVKMVMDLMNYEMKDYARRDSFLQSAGYKYTAPIPRFLHRISTNEYRLAKDTAAPASQSIYYSISSGYSAFEYSTTIEGDFTRLFNNLLLIGFSPSDTTRKGTIIYSAKSFNDRKMYVAKRNDRHRKTYHIFITEEF